MMSDTLFDIAVEAAEKVHAGTFICPDCGLHAGNEFVFNLNHHHIDGMCGTIWRTLGGLLADRVQGRAAEANTYTQYFLDIIERDGWTVDEDGTRHRPAPRAAA